MNTSYFAKYKGPNGISIARSSPKWYNGPIYLPLAPPMNLVYEYKNAAKLNPQKAQQDYTIQYIGLVLNNLDPIKVYNDLVALAGPDAVLLCWEKSGEFCHRHLVARWLMLGLQIPEIMEIDYALQGQEKLFY